MRSLHIVRIVGFIAGVIATYAALSGLFLPNSKLHIPGLGHASASSHKAGSLPSNHSIPHIVHMTWKNKNIRKDLAPNVVSWIKNHPHWQLRFWTDADVKPFIEEHYPQYMGMFEKWKWGGVKTADALRCFLLHHFGGVYADLDMESVRSMDEFVRDHPLVISTEPSEHTLVIFGKKRLSSNALMASRPGHPFWPLVFESMKAQKKDAPVLKATGPVMIDNWVIDYLEKHGPASASPAQPKDRLYLAPPAMFHPHYDPAMDYHCKRFMQQQQMNPKAVKTTEATMGMEVCKRLRKENFKQDKTLGRDTYSIHHWSHQWICPTCNRVEVPIDDAIKEAAAAARKSLLGH